MFQLNPLALTDAWWQHILMLAIPGVIGYIIGYRKRNSVISDLDNRLARLDADIERCNESTALPVVQKPTAVNPDDLKVVEGIGPAIEKLLNESGILTYAQLSGSSSESIRQILEKGGPRFQVHAPETWPRQAQLAASGQWEELKQWQDALDSGKA